MATGMFAFLISVATRASSPVFPNVFIPLNKAALVSSGCLCSLTAVKASIRIVPIES